MLDDFCAIAVVSYRNSTSNHNYPSISPCFFELYLIEILHQTTTNSVEVGLVKSCILSKFYIKPQQPQQPQHRTVSCILSKFYIKPQLCKPLKTNAKRCILSKFYIKPQRCQSYESGGQSCILSKFYIKPQQLLTTNNESTGCILSKFYIKPQPARDTGIGITVVSYRNSTSNHNGILYMG